MIDNQLINLFILGNGIKGRALNYTTKMLRIFTKVIFPLLEEEITLITNGHVFPTRRSFCTYYLSIEGIFMESGMAVENLLTSH